MNKGNGANRKPEERERPPDHLVKQAIQWLMEQSEARLYDEVHGPELKRRLSNLLSNG